jgi:hypothetical protein
MSERSRQLTGFLTLLVLLMVVVSACGSGGSTDTTSGLTSTTLGSIPTTPTDSIVGMQIEATDSTPAEYVDAIQQGKPVVILFYVTGAADDAKVLEAVNTLQGSFSNYAFLLYDYKTPDTYGDLSTLLQVNYPPELVLVDGTGTVKTVLNGYIDEGTINQSLVNLGNE